MLLSGQTAQDWLKFNYNLEIGSEFTYNKTIQKVKNIKETDNIGHFRTNYPVVIGIDYPESSLSEKITWITLEAIYGF